MLVPRTRRKCAICCPGEPERTIPKMEWLQPQKLQTIHPTQERIVNAVPAPATLPKILCHFFRCACMHAKHLRRSREANEERGEARVGVLGCTDKSQKPSATCLYTADFKRCGGSHTRTMRLSRPSGIPYFACCRLSSARRSSVSSRASSSGINVDWQVITWPTLRDVAQ